MGKGAETPETPRSPQAVVPVPAPPPPPPPMANGLVPPPPAAIIHKAKPNKTVIKPNAKMRPLFWTRLILDQKKEEGKDKCFPI